MAAPALGTDGGFTNWAIRFRSQAINQHSLGGSPARLPKLAGWVMWRRGGTLPGGHSTSISGFIAAMEAARYDLFGSTVTGAQTAEGMFPAHGRRNTRYPVLLVG